MPKEYPAEFKTKIIKRYQKGESIQSLSQELHIAQSTLYDWRRESVSYARLDNSELYRRIRLS